MKIRYLSKFEDQNRLLRRERERVELCLEQQAAEKNNTILFHVHRPWDPLSSKLHLSASVPRVFPEGSDKDWSWIGDGVEEAVADPSAGLHGTGNDLGH